MKQMKLNDLQILESLYDLADENGLTAQEYINRLQSQNEESVLKSREGLPEEVIKELENLKTLKKESRNTKKQTEQDESIKKEIEKFLSLFPDVKPNEIPDSVWDEVAEGASLPHAYAFFMVMKNIEDDYAQKINQDNNLRATSKAGEGETEPSFSKEQVEAMSTKEVSKNFKHILKSISKWKL